MKSRLSIGNAILALLRILTYASLLAAFVLLLSINNPQLLRPNRTSAITLSSFTVYAYVFMKIYGGYAIGLQKSKPIISQMSVSFVLADLISYLQLEIMNVNDKFNNRLILFGADFLLLLSAIAVQIALLWILVYIGNWLYFRLNPPSKCLVITGSAEDCELICSKLGRFKKQFSVRDRADYLDHDLHERIDACETVVLFRLPAAVHQELVEYCYACRKELYFDATIGDIIAQRSTPFVMDDVLMTAHVRDGLSYSERFAKRALDLVFSSIFLVVFSPAMLAAAIAIKIEDGGSVLFKQKRVTRGGKLFTIYKFRTMKENNGPERSALVDDDRITRVGNFLRKSRIDETPQFFNILKGDMSIVGPRPEMLSNYNKYVNDMPEYAYRSRVKAGLTGNAQVLGKYNTQPREKLMMDIEYIENFSILADLKLILKTIIVFTRLDATEPFDENPLDK